MDLLNIDLKEFIFDTKTGDYLDIFSEYFEEDYVNKRFILSMIKNKEIDLQSYKLLKDYLNNELIKFNRLNIEDKRENNLSDEEKAVFDLYYEFYEEEDCYITTHNFSTVKIILQQLEDSKEYYEEIEMLENVTKATSTKKAPTKRL